MHILCILYNGIMILHCVNHTSIHVLFKLQYCKKTNNEIILLLWGLNDTVFHMEISEDFKISFYQRQFTLTRWNVPSKILGSDIVIDLLDLDLLNILEKLLRLLLFFFLASGDIVTYIPSCKSSLERDDSPIGAKFSMLPFWTMLVWALLDVLAEKLYQTF